MLDNLPINRRELLKVGAGASLALSTLGVAATLTGCSPSRPAGEYRVLRDIDLPLLAALYPALVGPHPALLENRGLIQNALRQLDDTLAHTSPAIQQEVRDIFDLLTFAPSRGVLTGIWGNWDSVDPSRVEGFLQRWRDSRLELLRACYKVLCQLLQMSWYALPASWAAAGYPGPPTI